MILRRFLLRFTESMKIEQMAIRGQLSALSFWSLSFQEINLKSSKNLRNIQESFITLHYIDGS
jgi:hypothetical protein